MDLNTDIRELRGVGPENVKKLHKLGIFCISDLFFYYPRTYSDFTRITKIGVINCHSRPVFDSTQTLSAVERDRESTIVDPRLRGDDRGHVTIQGNIIGIGNKRMRRRGFTVTEAVVEDGTGTLKVVWFNQPYLVKMLRSGSGVILNGKVNYNWFSKELVMESPERIARPCIVPVYPETAGITSRYISKLIANCSSLIADINEWLPKQLAISYKLLSINEAIRELHFPTSMENIARAQRRIAFDELFMISLRANLSKEEIKKESAPALKIEDEKIAEFVKRLPFELTADQKKATWQIIKDIKTPIPMNRLLNGDVGSGKTVVAAIVALVAVKSGYRVAIMAPTSILATQHYETFCKLFEGQRVSIGLITSEKIRYSYPEFISGSQEMPKQVRHDNKKPHNSLFVIHNSDILIGTHALIQESVKLEDLGLVVVDEQHRFGVEQRSKLLKTGSEGLRPHFLSMTATPIPRTLHLSLFGDLDLSVIREKPAGRKEIKTRFVSANNREKAYQFICKQIKAGRQAFVICPLIESMNQESRGMNQGELFTEERKTVIEEHKKLQTIFPEFKIGMLHGRMPAKGGSASGRKAKGKNEIMADLTAGKIDILVSTSVVEVGVDVPNASVMVIEDAERFGLAQIHQFRGRVGRAEHQSYCFLFSATMNDKAILRLRSLEATTDGFKLAEIDLETKGPGAVFGTEQSGLLDLKMATLADGGLIEEASSAAKSIVDHDPELKKHPLLKEKVADFLQSKHLE